MAIPGTPLPPGRGTLREKIEWMLTRPLVLAYEAVIVPLGERLRAGVDSFLEQMEQRLLSYSRPWLGKLLESPDLPPEIRQVLQKVNAPEGQLEVAAVLGAVVGILIGIIQGAMQPISRLMSYFVERLVHTGRPDPATLVAMLLRGEIDNAHFESYLADLGFTDDLRDAYRETVRARIGAGELLTAMHRGEISESDVRSELHKLSYPDQDIDTILKLAPSLPGPGDLVRFALREVWRDDLRSELLSPDAPGRYYELMGKQGYAREFAEDYWASHWEIPGIRQGFEMFWRLPDFDEGDLRSLLTRLDVLPAYHDELIKIAYGVITRVDARRMYQFGILSEGEVFQSYLDQGYNPTDARRLTDLAIADAMETDRELTKADILNGYRDGVLTLSEASDMLQSINFSKEAAAFLLARVDAKRAQKLTDAEVRVLKDLYLNGDLTLTQVQERLTALGLPARQMELYAQEWKIDREGKIKRPSRATLERLYKSGTIMQEEFVAALDAIGYQEKYIGWYLRNITLERQVDAEKEEERARKERERVEKDRRKTAYQSGKASIDVEIAEVQAAISAADVALVEAQNDKNEALRAALPLEERGQIERDYMLIAHDADAAIGQARIVVADLRAEEKSLRSTLAEIDQSLATNTDVAEQVSIKASIAEMRTAQARFTDVAAILRVEIAEKKVAIEQEADADAKAVLKVELLELQVREAEEKQAITDVGIDIKEAQEQLSATMAEERRQELIAEQASVRVQIADTSERIATANASIAETATAKTNARNAMTAELTELPGAAQELEIRQHYDSLIERIKAQVKELRVRLSQLRVQKALLAFEYRGPSG